MNIDAFLNRIQFEQTPSQNLETLTHLQEQFLTHVPFENLTIQKSVPIDYHPLAVFDKVVERKQGGVCYELNSLFCYALLEMGFDARIIAAQMWPDKKPREAWDYDHMAVIVALDGTEYLMDVGNGIYLGKPLAINNSDSSLSEGMRFHCEKYDDEHLILLCQPTSSAAEQDTIEETIQRYVFKPSAVDRDDFKPACHFVETSPDSKFVQNRIVSKWTPEGRITLSGNTLVKTDQDKNREENTVAESDVNRVLEQYFGIGKTE
ncbi:arylamine N-acetyltransferase [Vibrio amylolyticus]|uniref:arylamine N-acetyltransferase family protein n=1 Tax=Vibrio amylolyticus TaxID=2847292 RepID=UPI00354E333D